MKLTESHLRNIIKQELKRFLNISESQDNKRRRYSPQEMQAIEDQIMRDEEDEEDKLGWIDELNEGERPLKEKLARFARK